jgi:hypothetical protein
MSTDTTKKDNFIDQIAESVQETHYHHKNISMQDALSIQSDQHQLILSKPERYSIFSDQTFDCVFFQRRGMAVDRILMVRELDEINGNGWFYRELSLTAESLGLIIDVVSVTNQGFDDYRKRIEEGEILSFSGHYLEFPISMPKVFVNPKYLKKHSGLNRRFQKNKLCPDCGEKMSRMASDQDSMKDKRIYLCPGTPEVECEFKVVVPMV